MKKYKRTRIVASLAVISSLAFSSTTFGATISPISLGNRVKEPTHSFTPRNMRMAENGSSTPAFDKKRYRTQKSTSKGGKRDTNHSISHFMGSITGLDESGFSLQKMFRGPEASTTPVIYHVITSSTTVYMKDGKLDSLTNLALGQNVVVTGTFDATTTTLTANGVDIISSLPAKHFRSAQNQ